MNRLEELYDQLVDLIPEGEIDHYMACGCTAGRDYDLMSKRLLIVEKMPKAEEFSDDCGCGDESCATCGDTGCSGHDHAHHHHDHAHHHSSLGNSQLNSTDFNEAIGKISRHLLGIKPDQWPNSIAKTYLYKIVPLRSKMTSELQNRQHDLCREILLEEIRAYDPTHVLFLTGWSGVWDFDFPLYPLLKGEMIEAVGEAENGAQLLVSRYAIRDSEDKFVADIVSAFRALDDNKNEE